MVMFIMLIAISIVSYYFPSSAGFYFNSKPADNSSELLNSSTPARSLFYSHRSFIYLHHHSGSTGTNEDAFLIKMKQRKLRHSVHIGLRACSTHGSGSYCGVWWHSIQKFLLSFLKKCKKFEAILSLKTPTHPRADSWTSITARCFNLRPI